MSTQESVARQFATAKIAEAKATSARGKAYAKSKATPPVQPEERWGGYTQAEWDAWRSRGSGWTQGQETWSNWESRRNWRR